MANPSGGYKATLKRMNTGQAVKLLIREACIGTGLGIAGGIVWKVGIAAPTTRAYKTYYNKYEKAGDAGPTNPENAEILEKVEKVIAHLEGGGAEEAEE